jgi:hypothetical protein
MQSVWVVSSKVDLAAHNVFEAKTHLLAIWRTAKEGHLLHEQVWDNQQPSGRSGFAADTGTTSVTPLA